MTVPSSSHDGDSAATDAPVAVVVRGGAPAKVARRLRTRRLLQARLARIFSIVPLLLLYVGQFLFLALPLPIEPIRRRTYVDENALQPAQAELFWNWDEVKTADTIAEKVTQLSYSASANSSSRAEALRTMFASYGLTAHTQNYLYDVKPTLFRSNPADAGTLRRSTISGSNTYALFRSPRTDGREAILITASWKSRWNGHDDPDRDIIEKVAARLAETGLAHDPLEKEGAAGTYELLKRKRVNVRGVASVVALSRYLSRWLHHSKDIIFVISDGHLDGMQAWASTYFGDDQPSNAVIDEIHPSVLGRRIWTSISIDYPSDSFSSLAILHEGTNAGSPNMDVLNTAVRVAQNLPGSSSIPVVLHGALPGALTGRGENYVEHNHNQAKVLRRFLPGWLIGLLERFVWQGENGSASLVLAAKALLTQFRLMASGHPSGPHGLLHKYRIDAFTLYAVPDRGPYGFYHMGRTVESTLRSFSNLVERLHHSQFFYLLTDPWHFVQLPTYIVVPVLLGIAITIYGLRAWRREGRLTQAGREEVAQAFEAWLDQQAIPAAASSSGEKIDTLKHNAIDKDLAVVDESLAEIEDLLPTMPSGSQIRQRPNQGTTSTKAAATPRRSERIRLSASPEPASPPPSLIATALSANAAGLAKRPAIGKKEESVPRRRRRTALVDIPPETPTAAQIQLQLGTRAQALLAPSGDAASVTTGGAGTKDAEEASRLLREALEAQDRPVWQALGLMGVAHVGAGLGVLGLVRKLDQCDSTGLWTCSVFRLLNIFSVAFPLLLTTFAFAYTRPTSTRNGSVQLTIPRPDPRARIGRLLHAFTLLYAGMLVSVLSVLNFALATSMGLLLARPLCFSAVGRFEEEGPDVKRKPRSSGKTISPKTLRAGRLLPELVILLVLFNPSLSLRLLARWSGLDAGALEAGLESVWIGWRLWGNFTVPFVGVVFQAIIWQAAVGVALSLLS
ncbi:hypothetical protein V8E36_001390 [Tilletia maclaganii]